MLAIDYFGERYDDAVPSFVIVSDKLVWHRPGFKLLDYPSLQDAMTADGYTPGTNEIGKDDAWVMKNLSIDSSGAAGTAPSSVVAGVGTTSATITMAGDDATSAGTVTLVVEVDATAITGLTPVTIGIGDTSADIAAAIAAELNGKQDVGATLTLAASAVGDVVTVTEAGGGTITTLTATVA